MAGSCGPRSASASAGMSFPRRLGAVRIFFATDIHGSEIVLAEVPQQRRSTTRPTCVVLGGDMTGKALVPIIDDGGGDWHATLLENREELTARRRSRLSRQAVMRRGYYPFRTDPDELARAGGRRGALARAVRGADARRRCEQWMEMADERLGGTGDPRASSAPATTTSSRSTRSIREREDVELGEGRVVDIDGFQMASSGWANRTPWDTYREEDEPELAERIEAMIVEQVTAPPERTIFSLHCPPYGTGLDDAPELTEDMDLKDAGHARRSRSARRRCARRSRRYQPALSLHGHIHEARGNHAARPHALHQPRQLLRAGPAARRGDRPRRQEEGQEVRLDKRLGCRYRGGGEARMATIAAGEAPYEERALFVRKATGLVRGWSVRDAFIYAAFSINLVTLGLYIFSYAPFIPSGSLFWAVDPRRRVPGLPGDHLRVADRGDAARRRRLRLDEPRAGRRHRLRAGGLRLVVHPLALGPDLRQHPRNIGCCGRCRRSSAGTAA